LIKVKPSIDPSCSTIQPPQVEVPRIFFQVCVAPIVSSSAVTLRFVSRPFMQLPFLAEIVSIEPNARL
jgi:hypothetical protein